MNVIGASLIKPHVVSCELRNGWVPSAWHMVYDCILKWKLSMLAASL